MLSHANPHFDSENLAAARAFLERTVLGTLILNDARGFRSLQSPWTAVASDGGALTLTTHVPRRSALVESVQAGSSAFALFQGEHGYISPSWFPIVSRDRGPTWNYEVFEATGPLRRLDEARLLDHLAVLTTRAEASVAGNWALAEMGPRFDVLSRQVVAIDMAVECWAYRRKLGQDEREDDFNGALEHLEQQGRERMARRMREERSRT